MEVIMAVLLRVHPRMTSGIKGTKGKMCGQLTAKMEGSFSFAALVRCSG